MQTYSIGFTRSDGDFELLATLNNTGEHLSNDDFETLKNHIIDFIKIKSELSIEALHRQDAYDIVELEGD